MNTRKLLVTCLSAMAFPCVAQAQVRLVADIATEGGFSHGSDAEQLFSAGDTVFFVANEPSTGREVYASDGSKAGTHLLQDLCPGPCGSDIAFLGTVDGRTTWLWNANHWPSGYQLWSSDGSREGTTRLTPEGIYLFEAVSDYLPEATHNYAWFEDRLYFQACDETGCELWRTDGTPSGTESVSSPLGLPDDGDWSLVPAGHRLYLVNGTSIWFTDGVTAQHVAAPGAHGVTSPHVGSFTGIDGKLFFVAGANGGGDELWVTNGSAGNLGSISDFPNQRPFGSRPLLKALGDHVYFIADDVVHGFELWMADGTPAGTRRITDFGFYAPFGELEYDSYDADRLQMLDGTVLFVASDGLSPRQVWTTSGWPASTAPLVPSCTGGCVDPYTKLFRLPEAVVWKTGDGAAGFLWGSDGTPGSASALLGAAVHFVLQVGHEVVFSSGGPGNHDLWATDGTVAGTRRITELADRGPNGGVALLHGGYLFTAGSHEGPELWFTDGSGTAGGTRLVARLGLSNASSHPVEVAPTGARLTVNACGAQGRYLWSIRPDGGDLTQLRHVGYDCSDLYSAQPLPLTSHHDLAFWAANQSWEPSQLWRTDGTPGGTFALLSVEGQIVGPASLGEFVYFIVNPPNSFESELWRSDGTVAGTQPVVELDGTAWAQLRRAGDLLVAPMYRGGGIHLLRSDGTPQGTWEIGGNFTHISEVVAAGPWLYFAALDEAHGLELWWSDGSPAPATRLTNLDVSCCGDELRELTAHGDEAYFFAVVGGRWGFFRASPAGTEQLADFPLPDHLATGSLDMVSFGDRVLFAADDGEHGFEPWVSDGTAFGTRLLADLYPGGTGSDPAEMTVVGDRVLFAARDPFYGRELHVTDGTAAGTSLVADIFAGGHSSAPKHFTAIGSTLYFSADDGVHGHELWSWNASAHPAPPSGPWLTSAAVPGFRFKVRITNQQGEPLAGAQEPACIAETLCVSGALAGRSEVFLRVVGPKPNGLLWPTLVKFSTSQVEVWVEQEGSGEQRYYLLEGAAPGFDRLPGMFDRLGFQPQATSGSGVAAPAGVSTPIAPGAWFTSEQFPGFRFKVRISNQQGQESPLQLESDCIEETVCLSGAVPGRSELFLRIVGPKPNGYLWPTLVKFSTSTIDVWIEQIATATEKHYRLEGAAPGIDDLSGLFDRTGFLP